MRRYYYFFPFFYSSKSSGFSFALQKLEDVTGLDGSLNVSDELSSSTARSDELDSDLSDTSSGSYVSGGRGE